jgi:hypothetical protein
MHAAELTLQTLNHIAHLFNTRIIGIGGLISLGQRGGLVFARARRRHHF